MQSLTDRLEMLHIKPVDEADYQKVYHQLQRDHETWLKYLILRYTDQFNTAIFASAGIGILLCLLGGIGYFFSYPQFGNLSVGIGLVSFGVCVGLMLLGFWSNTQHFNMPNGDTGWNKAKVEEFSRLPNTVRNIIGGIEQNTGKEIWYHFSFEGFFNPKTETETVLWTLWAKDAERIPRDRPKRVYFWVDGPRTIDAVE